MRGWQSRKPGIPASYPGPWETEAHGGALLFSAWPSPSLTLVSLRQLRASSGCSSALSCQCLLCSRRTQGVPVGTPTLPQATLEPRRAEGGPELGGRHPG